MPVSAVVADLVMFLGTDKTFADTIYQSDGVTPQDITNWSLKFVVHAYGDQSTVFITKTTGGGGITIPLPTNGLANITVNAADTVNMFPGQYGWYVERTDSGADDVLSYGLFTLLQRAP